MLISHGSVVTMDPSSRVLDSGFVRIQDGVITDVSDVPLKPADGEDQIDASGMVVLPGLVNTHTHMFQTLLRAVYDELPLADYLGYVYRCGLELTEEDCRRAAVLGSVEALRSGVTTVVDHHFLNRGNELANGTLRGMQETGVRTVLARTVMDIGDGLPPEILETAEQGLRYVEELLREYRHEQNHGDITLMTGPNTPGINASAEVCIATRDFAASNHIRRSAHVAEYRGVVDAVKRRYGIDGAVHWLHDLGVLGPDLLAVHAVQVTDEEVDLLGGSGCGVSHNPFSNLFCGDRNAPVDRLLGAGVAVGLGTDGAANNNGQGVLDALRLTRLLQRSRPDPFAISPDAGLRMATIDGARSLGLDDRIGSIEEGKQGDIITVRLGQAPHMVPLHNLISHVAHFAKGSDVDSVIVGGRTVIRRGEFPNVDEAAVFGQAQEAAVSLVKRLG